MQGLQKDREDQRMLDACSTDWKLVAMVLDRFLLIIFTLLTIAVSLGILTNHPSHINDAESLVE